MKYYHFIVLFFLFSCEKIVTDTIEVEKVTSWQQLTQIYHDDKIIYNSETDSSNIYFFGQNTFVTMTNNTPTFYSIGGRISNSKPAMSKKYSVDKWKIVHFKSDNSYEQRNGIRVIVNQSPHDIFTRNPNFSFHEFDSSFSIQTEISVSNYFTRSIGFLSNNDYFFTIVRDPLNDYRMAILICKINVSGDFITEKVLTLDEKRVIDIPANFALDYVTSFFEADGNFIFSSNSKTYLLDKAGNLNQVLDKYLEDIVSFENKLFARSWSNLYMSNDNGLSWVSLGNNIPLNSKFFIINNSLGLHVGHQISIIDLKTNQLVELKNDGLESNQIVSIKKYNNQVFVSTLSGVFYKNINSFFDNKPSISGK